MKLTNDALEQLRQLAEQVLHYDDKLQRELAASLLAALVKKYATREAMARATSGVDA